MWPDRPLQGRKKHKQNSRILHEDKTFGGIKIFSSEDRYGRQYVFTFNPNNGSMIAYRLKTRGHPKKRVPLPTKMMISMYLSLKRRKKI